ncbi:hypothetical protein [Rhodococcus sp. HNM0569]|uniref:hypothetical protein n=1 Tax=Rhodococcus sp. HNM0569 TaxID=2716340 RepID=UPI00146F7AB6|nr:hypothetical protein [Rhodococcus sp. HNM0569]NLU83268.1 hypothetical protein [Rhodococcus sp. HNM0569]
MQSVTCRTCGNRVLAEKYSEEHTSVQWLADSERVCAEFSARTSLGETDASRPTCTALRDSIDAEVAEGKLVLTTRSYPVPGRLE